MVGIDFFLIQKMLPNRKRFEIKVGTVMMHYTLSGETTLSKLFLSPSDKIPKFNANNVDPDQSLDCLPMSLFIWDVRHKRFSNQ